LSPQYRIFDIEKWKQGLSYEPILMNLLVDNDGYFDLLVDNHGYFDLLVDNDGYFDVLLNLMLRYCLDAF
jgi:hypothetical protein